ncbi:MAG TPA: urease accessory protein UreD [Alphaproteobacteria bacterium]|jgi:urease accessory protein
MPFESTPAAPRLQRCDGALILALTRGPAGETRIDDLYQRDPCRALFPESEPDDVFQAVMLTTSGGLAGGDRIAAAITAGAATRALVTAQAAEKVYRARAENTLVSVDLSVGTGAWLEWLPQETILFDGARFRRETRVALAADARLLAAEIVVFGRTARGERIARGHYLDRWRIARERRLVWADALGWTDHPRAALAHPAGFAGAVAAATVVYAGPDAAGLVDRARQALSTGSARSAVSCVNGLLVARFLAKDAQALRNDLAQLWCTIRAKAANLPARLPRTWYT